MYLQKWKEDAAIVVFVAVIVVGFSREIVYREGKILHLCPSWRKRWILNIGMKFFNPVQHINIHEAMAMAFSDLRAEQKKSSCIFLLISPVLVLSGSSFQLWSGDKGWVMLFWKIILLHAIIVTSGGWGRWEAGGQAGGGVARAGAEEDCEKLSCVTVILVDSWSALFHRSPYCLLGGLSGRKQVSVQIVQKKKNTPDTLSHPSFSPCVIWWPSSMVTPRRLVLGPYDWDYILLSLLNLDYVRFKEMGERI